MRPDTPEALVEWARTLVGQDFEKMVPKVVEYGAIDLELVGQALAEMANFPVTREADGPVIGIVFYLLGKISRAVSAVAAGHLPSEDTLMDITIYSLMARFVDEFGSWGLGTPPASAEKDIYLFGRPDATG